MTERSGSGGRLVDDAISPAAAGVDIEFDGQRVPAYVGETVAAALTAAGVRELRSTRTGEARGVYCGMGVCFECLVEIDGRPNQRACMTKVNPGMRVVTQRHQGTAAGFGETPLAHERDGGSSIEAVQVLVIGAGPAGLAAGEAAASAGASVTVLDERPEPGGQYYKQLAPSYRFSRDNARDRQFASGAALIRRVRDAGVTILSEATVWRAAHDPATGIELDVFREGRVERFQPEQLIVATGAYERPHAVPGWTLPGVMTTGAAQTLARAYRVAPGTRVLIAGNGPLNLQVAYDLIRGGVSVVAVAEAAPQPGLGQIGTAARAFARGPDLIGDGLRYLAALARHRVPILYRHAVLRCEGAGRVERVTLTRIDGGGRPLAGSEAAYEVDAVCLGYGFAPSNELTRLLGCRHRADAGALRVERDEDGQTSQPGVFVAGDCAGIGGARLAQSQGVLAGLAAARRLSFPVQPEHAALAARTQRACRRDAAFQRALWQLFEAPALVDGFTTDDTLICRCESVTAGTIRGLLASGVDEIGALKRMTRTGMGQCQGRNCGPAIARLCAAARGEAVDEWSFFAPRFPAKPVPIPALANEQGEWGEQDQGRPPPAPKAIIHARARAQAADVAVIGGGIIGACAAYYLARDGADVVLLERGQPNGEASGNNAGSLHVQLLAYDFGDRAQAGGGPAAQALPLQRESAALWPHLAAELERDLEIEITGGLMLAEDEASLDQLRKKATLERSHGTEVEILSTGELRDLAPALSERMVGAAWCPAEGKINPMIAAPAVIDGALAAGLRLHKETEVHAIERVDGRFEIETNRGPFRAGKVLNACGGWSASVARMVGVSLPTRAHPIQLIVTEPAPPLLSHLLAYADRHLTLKQVRNGNLVIGGGWRAGLDPRTERPRVLGESLEGNLWVALRALPALRALHVIRSWAAMNVAIDGAPILGEAPGVPGFYQAVTVNGVTLAPLIGRVIADAIRTGESDPSLGYFGLSRF